MSVQFPAVRFRVQHWYHTLVLLGAILMFLGATVESFFADNTAVFIFGWGLFLIGTAFWANKDSGIGWNNPEDCIIFYIVLLIGASFIVYAFFRIIPGDLANCDLIKAFSNSGTDESEIPQF